MNIEKIAKEFVRRYRLKKDQPKKLPLAEVAGLRGELKDIWKRSFPRTPYESGFMEQTNYHPTALTEGYVERREEGVDIVLLGNDADDRSVWLAFNLPYKGDPTLTSKCQIFPSDESYVAASCQVVWPITVRP